MYYKMRYFLLTNLIHFNLTETSTNKYKYLCIHKIVKLFFKDQFSKFYSKCMIKNKLFGIHEK